MTFSTVGVLVVLAVRGVALRAPRRACVARGHAVVVRTAATDVQEAVDIRRLSTGGDLLSTSVVPSFAVTEAWVPLDAADAHGLARRRLDVNGVDGAFMVLNVLSATERLALLRATDAAGFGEFDAGKNAHGAAQLVVPPEWIALLEARLQPFMPAASGGAPYARALNPRLRVYKYAPNGRDRFAPHIDAGFARSQLDAHGELAPDDGSGLRSRLTVLLYLNDDFDGGETRFYKPMAETDGELELLCAVAPVAGAALLFPQALGEEQVEVAREQWATHEGSPVRSGAAKYVVRTDAMFGAASDTDDETRRAAALEDALRQRSPAFDADFLRASRALYSPYMGVENLAPLLYSLARFTHARRVVEVGAGCTSLWLLRALADTDADIARLREVERAGEARLLDWPWTVSEALVDDEARASLLCIDDCAHGAESASKVVEQARALGLEDRLEFLVGDALAEESPLFSLEADSVDLFWLDAGLGADAKRVASTMRAVFKSLKPGALLAVHSSLTNRATREWLEAVRAGAPETETGVDPQQLHHLALLEPHKRFQNAIALLQKRPLDFKEPLYSERP